VGNLPRHTSPDEIKEEFKEFGPVTSVQWKDDYCFVEVETREAAEQAIRVMNGRRMNGVTLKVQLSNDARRKINGIVSPIGRTKPGEGKIVIENLPLNTEWQEVKDFFRKVGIVVRADVLEENGRPNGKAIVIFERDEDAKRAAVDCNQVEFAGKRIKCAYEHSTPHYSQNYRGGPRKSGRSRSRSRSRSNSRSRRGRSRSPNNSNNSSQRRIRNHRDHSKSRSSSRNRADREREHERRSRGGGVAARIPRDIRDSRDNLRDSRDARDSRDLRDGPRDGPRDSRDFRDSRDNLRDHDMSRDMRDSRDPKFARGDSRDSRDSRDLRDSHLDRRPPSPLGLPRPDLIDRNRFPDRPPPPFLYDNIPPREFYEDPYIRERLAPYGPYPGAPMPTLIDRRGPPLSINPMAPSAIPPLPPHDLYERELRDRDIRDLHPPPIDPHDLRDFREFRDLPDPRDIRDPRDFIDPRDARDPRVRDPRDLHEIRDPRDLHEIREPRSKDFREVHNPRARDPRDSRDAPRDPRNGARDSRDLRESRDTRDPRDSRDLRDSRDGRDSRRVRDGRDFNRDSRDSFAAARDGKASPRRGRSPPPPLPSNSSSSPSTNHRPADGLNAMPVPISPPQNQSQITSLKDNIQGPKTPPFQP